MSEEWTDRIVIRELKLDMSIGIYEGEREKKQPVTVTIKLDVLPNQGRPLEHIDEVVSYESIVRSIQKICGARHYDLVERLAEDVAHLCLSYERVTNAEISVIKTEIMPETNGVGIGIRRAKRD